MLAMVANDNACILDERGAADFFASELAPTGESESTLFGVFAEIPGSSLSRVFFIPKEL
ncbi:hypothetical protein [Pseudomonas fluorescens]|uniref:Uncharacterized protein n=1 Tax=Pseudomonas fluorescens TaxID=294 RepID=A0A5E6WKS2_PSEFL|nr:hypothetical protein [Pseudomonas fluorescens]VVN28621.1 hypothetical protein PS659_04757 [Pseudomonas fluorescens]